MDKLHGAYCVDAKQAGAVKETVRDMILGINAHLTPCGQDTMCITFLGASDTVRFGAEMVVKTFCHMRGIRHYWLQNVYR